LIKKNDTSAPSVFLFFFMADDEPTRVKKKFKTW